MKKINVLIAGVFLLMNSAFAGGILTNTNQSAQFVRMLSRNASTDLDAVYFNPAGLTQLNNGFYFGLHNQSITQNRTITSEFPLLNNGKYKGAVSAPVFPTAFAVYKIDKWAFSAGFGPNGGGGSAKYDTGLPSFEKKISAIPMSLVANGIPTNEYSANIKFEGTSVFWGTQLNGTYSLNENISISLGVRMLNAVNTYNGYLKDIKINPNQPAFGASYNGTNMVSATQFFTDGKTFLNFLSASSTASAAALAPAISGGSGSVLLANASSIGLTADQIAGIQQLLGAAGMTPTQIGGATLAVAAGTLTAAAPEFAGKASSMEENATATSDINVDTKQTGTGFTPIIGFDIHLEKLNIGVKYEHQTTLKLTNSTVVDGTGLFTDKEESRSDIPGIFAAGADYKLLDNLKVSGSYTVYFDKSVGWGPNVYGQNRTIDKNYVELAFGVEYSLNKNFAISAGYLNSNMGVSEAYQSDFSYANDSYTAGLGFQWNINTKLVLDAGLMLTTYKDYTKTFDSSFDPLATSFGSYNETYGKDTFTFAFGIGYKIF
ncbi:MAG: hypothetical protein WC384_17645 [Prolixibacteraceae bacterium]|jgi:long-subunit fatty acid transport protein